MTDPIGGYSFHTRAVAGSRTARSAADVGGWRAGSPFPDPSDDTLVFHPWPDRPLAAFGSQDAGTAWQAGDLIHAGGTLPRYHASHQGAAASPVPADIHQASHSGAAWPHPSQQTWQGHEAAWGRSARVHDAPSSVTDRVVGKLEDAGIRADVAKALSGAKVDDPFHLDHAALTHILEDAAAGGVTASEFRTLKTLDGLINTSGGFQASEYDAYITHALISGNAANVDWTGGTTGDSVALGNLAAGSSELQADRLIGKWFLGTDHPGLKDTWAASAQWAPGGVTAEYALDPDPLYGKGGTPLWQQFHQASLGDCYLVATVGEIALKEPDAIKSMFTDNGDGTYGVRFYDWNDKPVYVTVDSQLPYFAADPVTGERIMPFSGPEIGATDRAKWGALIEKAYAQLNDGKVEYDHDLMAAYDKKYVKSTDGLALDRGNYYINIEGGYTELVHYITGKHMTFSTDPKDPKVINAIHSNQEVLISFDGKDSGRFLEGHMYQVINYHDDTGKYDLRNPWGSNDYCVFSATPEEIKAHDAQLFYVSEPAHFLA